MKRRVKKTLVSARGLRRGCHALPYAKLARTPSTVADRRQLDSLGTHSSRQLIVAAAAFPPTAEESHALHQLGQTKLNGFGNFSDKGRKPEVLQRDLSIHAHPPTQYLGAFGGLHIRTASAAVRRGQFKRLQSLRYRLSSERHLLQIIRGVSSIATR